MMNENEITIEKEELIDNDNKYIIHIDNFDGPLDLLWNLIKKASIDIAEVSISKITEQYIEYIKNMEKKNIQIASDFILMASELLYYKSKALLPGEELEDEYFVPPLPPELIQKLLEYKKFQNASMKLREKFDQQADSFIRENFLGDMEREDEYINVSLFDLLSAFAAVMDSVKEIEQRKIIFDEILVSDRINYITELLKVKEQILFTDIFEQNFTRYSIVANFLAILEMAKMRKIKIMQHRVFGEIRIFRAFISEDNN
jgi:segregation and condensation protein A